MPALRETLSAISGFVEFWIRVFIRAASAVWQLYAHQKLSTMALVLVISIVGLLVRFQTSGEQSVKEYIKFALAPLLIVLFVLFGYQLIVTPYREYKDQREQVRKLSDRCKMMVGKLPSPQLNEDQRQRFKAAIEPLAGNIVLIEYLDDPYSRAQALADSLESVFRDSGWRVTMKKSKPESVPVNGLNMRVGAHGPFGKAQSTVSEAFTAIGMPNSLFSSDADVGDGHVELLIGEL